MACRRIGHWKLILLSLFLSVSWQAMIPEIGLASDSLTSPSSSNGFVVDTGHSWFLLADRYIPGAGGEITKPTEIYQAPPIYQQPNFWWYSTIVGCLVVIVGLVIGAPIVIVFGVGLMLLCAMMGANIEDKQRGADSLPTAIVKGIGWLINHILRCIVVIEGAVIHLVNPELGDKFLHAAYPNFFTAQSQPTPQAAPSEAPCGDAVQVDGECWVPKEPEPVPTSTPQAPSSTPSSPPRSSGSGGHSEQTGSQSKETAPDPGRSETGKRFGELWFNQEPKD